MRRRGPALCLCAGLAGCRADGLTVQAALSPDMPTVVQVDWSAADDVDAATIEYGHDGVLDRSVQADSSGRVLLAGLKPQRPVALQLVVQGDGRTERSEILTVQTGTLPGDLPALQLDAEVDDGLHDGFLVTTHVQSPGAAMVVDQDGDVVWWWALSDELRLSRARLSLDGRSVFILPVNHLGEQDHGVEIVALDGSSTDRAVVDDAHHDMVELPDGTLTFLVHDPRQVEGVGEVFGDKLVELAPDGTQRTLWSTWDTFDYDPDQHVLDGVTWTHANAIDYLPDQDVYLVGLLGLPSILQIDRGGQVEWILGTDQGDFVDDDGQPLVMDFHHQFDRVEDGIVIFENGPGERQASRAFELALDVDAGTATEVWSYQPDPDQYTYSMGSVQRLDSGRSVVAFSVNGQVDVVDADAALLWRLRSDLGAAFGYVEWAASLSR